MNSDGFQSGGDGASIQKRTAHSNYYEWREGFHTNNECGSLDPK